MSKIIALKVSDTDNVATVFFDVKAGDGIEIIDKKGDITPVKVLNDIPYGHKVAVKSIKIGEQITKYGEEIGVATAMIEKGGYVHVHNLDSMRARGDKA